MNVRIVALVSILLWSGWSRAAVKSEPTWSESKAFYLAKLTQDPYWKKRWWLEKTIRVARAGRGPQAGDDLDAMMALPESEIVARLMDDPRFGDMVFDFNLHLLGFRKNSLWKGDDYASDLGDFPSALASAREVIKGGDYFRLFDLSQEFLMTRPSTDFRLPNEPEDIQELYAKRYAKLHAVLDATLSGISLGTLKSTQQACQQLIDNQNTLVFYLDLFPTYFQVAGVFDEPEFIGRLEQICFQPDRFTLSDLETSLIQQTETLLKLNAQIQPFYAPSYHPRNVEEVAPFDLAAAGLTRPARRWNFYGTQFRFNVVNTSTNFDRKRGAYALKHFFVTTSRRWE